MEKRKLTEGKFKTNMKESKSSKSPIHPPSVLQKEKEIMRTNLSLKDITLEFDGAEGGKVWIFGSDDEMCYIKASEIQETINFLSTFIKDK